MAVRKKATPGKEPRPKKSTHGKEPRAAAIFERLIALPGDVTGLLDQVERLVESVTKAGQEYRKTHWGKKPPQGAVLTFAADPGAEPVVALGELVSVVYRTRKGDDERLTDYEHTFSKVRPLLCYAPKQGAKLLVCGGTYTVTKRGIEG